MGNLSKAGASGYPQIRRRKNKRKRSCISQPFFEKLQLDIQVSEPDERLNSREDILSSLDGLHEDIYFVGTDYFKNYGIEKAGQVTDAPGLILPKIRKSYGKPEMKVTVFSQMAQEPEILLRDGTRIGVELQQEQVNVWLDSIQASGADKTAVLQVEGVPEEVVLAYVELLNEGALELAEKLEGISKIIFR